MRALALPEDERPDYDTLLDRIEARDAAPPA